jgi:ABC-2 type transport system permease protein
VRLLYSELLKVRTAPRTTLVLVIGLLALVGLGSAGISHDAQSGFVTDAESDIVDVAGTATIFALILAILVVTWDYRHGTITQTLLATPRRERVVAAKLLVAVLLGVVLAAIALALAIVIAEVWLGGDFKLTGENCTQAGRIVVACMLWAVLGLGLGATLQTQVGALITALVWFLVVEFVFVGLGWRIGDIGRYLPGQALSEFASGAPPEHLERTTAALLSAAYAFGLAALGTISVLRRDVP